jgi:hypothetical protein
VRRRIKVWPGTYGLIRKLYAEDCYDGAEVAARAGVTVTVVYGTLKRMNIPRRAAGKRHTPPADRFWGFVQKHPDGCWNWIGCLNAYGYGQFVPIAGDQRPAHRYSYELLVGPIGPGLQIDHLCRNRRCVNPSHLEPVSSAVNNARGLSPSAINGRKTHCTKGHLFDETNTYTYTRGSGSVHRSCRTCRREASKRQVLYQKDRDRGDVSRGVDLHYGEVQGKGGDLSVRRGLGRGLRDLPGCGRVQPAPP